MRGQARSGRRIAIGWLRLRVVCLLRLTIPVSTLRDHIPASVDSVRCEGWACKARARARGGCGAASGGLQSGLRQQQCVGGQGQRGVSAAQRTRSQRRSAAQRITAHHPHARRGLQRSGVNPAQSDVAVAHAAHATRTARHAQRSTTDTRITPVVPGALSPPLPSLLSLAQWGRTKSVQRRSQRRGPPDAILCADTRTCDCACLCDASSELVVGPSRLPSGCAPCGCDGWRGRVAAAGSCGRHHTAEVIVGNITQHGADASGGVAERNAPGTQRGNDWEQQWRRRHPQQQPPTSPRRCFFSLRSHVARSRSFAVRCSSVAVR